MISISDAIKEIIQGQPFIEEGLSRGIINLSAFAREVKPQIEKKLFKSVKEGAVVMALKRISEKLSKNHSEVKSVNLTDLTVRSNLTELTFQNSPSLVDKQRELFNQLAEKKGVFCTVSQGIRETTFIADPDSALAVERIFSSENMLKRIDNLSSITIHLPQESVQTPGIYYQVLKLLVWDNVNIVEVVSTYTEFTIVFDEKDVDRAFSIIKNLGKVI